MNSLNQSLKRMNLDYVDIFYSHRYDPETPLEETLQALVDIVRQGKALYVGISKYPKEAAEFAYRYLAERDVHCLLYQGRYNMFNREPEEEGILQQARENGTGFIAFSPLAQGLLTNRYTADTSFDPETDYRASMPQYRPESFEKNRALFSLLEQLANEHRATASQISLAWMMNKRPAIVPIPGTRHLYRLKENIGAADIHLTDEEVKAIDTALDAMEMSEVFGGSPIKK